MISKGAFSPVHARQ